VGVLVLAVLLLLIMPALLYAVGKGVVHYTKPKPKWVDLSPRRVPRSDKQSAVPHAPAGD
jgi:hypothetical protein